MKEAKTSHTQATILETVESHAEPCILEEIVIEELAIDGICGVY